MDVVYAALSRSTVLNDFDRAFRDATGLSLACVPRGKPQSRAAFRNAENPFCALIAGTARGRAACMEIQRALQRRLERETAPQKTRCFAAMTEVAVPVVVGGQHVATLLGGQVFGRKPSRRQFERLAPQLCTWGLRGQLGHAKQAYVRTPVVSERRLRGAVCLLALLARHLAEAANRLLLATRRDDPPPVAEAKSFARAHAGRRVTLDEVADHVHLSRYYFCRTFRHATGMTFTEYLARVRVESAKRLLGDPFLRVGEVSDQAGFASISQFNRVFHRYVGRSPTAYRAALPREVKR